MMSDGDSRRGRPTSPAPSYAFAIVAVLRQTNDSPRGDQTFAHQRLCDRHAFYVGSVATTSDGDNLSATKPSSHQRLCDRRAIYVG